MTATGRHVSDASSSTRPASTARSKHIAVNPSLFCNALETDVVIVGVIAVACLPARSTTYDPALPAIRRPVRANCVCVVIAARMLRQQSRAVAEHYAVFPKREGAACLDQPQCFGCFPGNCALVTVPSAPDATGVPLAPCAG